MATFNAKADAHALKGALHFFGTKYDVINGIFGNRSKEQLLEIANEFAQENEHSLHHAIEHASKTAYAPLLCNLLKSPLALKTEFLKDGSSKYVVDALVPSSNAEVLELFQNSPETVAKLIVSTHFSFKKCIEILLKGKRDETNKVDDAEAQKTAETLFKAGEGKLGTDDDTFINVVCNHSPAFLQRVSHHYAAAHGHSLDAGIKKETSGEYQHLLIGCTKTRHEYFADRFHDSLHWIGRDDKFIQYAFATLGRKELPLVAAIFKDRHGKELSTLIKSDTGGHYEELLLMLCNQHPSQH